MFYFFLRPLTYGFTSKGKFVFNTHEPGEHSICLRSNSTRWFGNGKLRVHLQLQVGEAANDYENIMKKEQLSQVITNQFPAAHTTSKFIKIVFFIHFSKVETRLYQLLQQVRQIANEQAYQRVFPCLTYSIQGLSDLFIKACIVQ